MIVFEKFEAGKFYRGLFSKQIYECKYSGPVRGVLFDVVREVEFFTNHNCRKDFEEYIPKKSGSKWAVITEFSQSYTAFPFDNKEKAKKWADDVSRNDRHHKIMAIKEISWTEGEGL